MLKENMNMEFSILHVQYTEMSRILIREGARPRVSGFFFKAAVQSVLLFGAETWVVIPCTRRVISKTR